MSHRKITEGEVGESYVPHVVELDHKIAYLKSQQTKPVRAFRDVGPELERLRLRVRLCEFDYHLLQTLIVHGTRPPRKYVPILQRG